MSLVVVELGVGNTASMLFALERLGARPVLSSDPGVIAGAERLILPGVGAAGWAMARVRALGLEAPLSAYRRPLLGICLGQQVLFDTSEEGDARGLGRIPGVVRRLRSAPDRPVPHMGWNRLRARRDDPLLEGVADGAFVYFVHSFAAPVGEHALAETTYGEPFAAAVRRGNAWGCQFHPERSSEVGARILRNFMALSC